MGDLEREDLLRVLPYARRYARALSGSQKTGDALVAEALRELMADPPESEDVRLAIYAGVTSRFNEMLAEQNKAEAAKADSLSHLQRSLLLLTALEDCSVADAAFVVQVAPDVARTALDDARDRLKASAASDVLIIEDEPIIAMDLEELARSCGHRVVGVASTETEAVEIARRTQPGLILADINLGAGGDGKTAVARILETLKVPVIFVTAYPERLLTGEAVEPAFVIAKPFEPTTLAIATYQAVTGGVALD